MGRRGERNAGGEGEREEGIRWEERREKRKKR